MNCLFLFLECDGACLFLLIQKSSLYIKDTHTLFSVLHIVLVFSPKLYKAPHASPLLGTASFGVTLAFLPQSSMDIMLWRQAGLGGDGGGIRDQYRPEETCGCLGAVCGLRLSPGQSACGGDAQKVVSPGGVGQSPAA